MEKLNFDDIFTSEVLRGLFPADRTPQFFEALFGDDNEGSYDIALKYRGQDHDKLKFEFELLQRPGKCLVCSLTYGLPQVFSRHPAIGVENLVQKINSLLDGQLKCTRWQFGATLEMRRELHIVPLTVFID